MKTYKVTATIISTKGNPYQIPETSMIFEDELEEFISELESDGYRIDAIT